MSDTWRVALCLEDLRAEVNHRWPKRDKTSDGAVGDLAHRQRSSDHNPDAHEVVKARDFDRDLVPGNGTQSGLDMAWLAEHLRQLGKAGDKRLIGGGYVIYNGRIASDLQGWAWRQYDGTNPHRHHVHVSCTHNPAHYDDHGSWGVATVPKPAAKKTPAKKRPTTPFPLAADHWYGPESDDKRNHSGYWPKDRKAITRIRAYLKCGKGTRYDEHVFAAVTKRQHELGIRADGLVGKQAWARFGL